VTVLAEAAFAELVAPLRGPLLAHCYRMLGSVQDAEDALQDALLRAWRALPSFDAGRPLRPWLYRIATNVCLDTIARRPRRGLPVDGGAAASGQERGAGAVREPVWLEPIADVSLVDEEAPPDARFEQRETLELAFLAALQLLPGNQRAALLLCEVLAFSAPEAAELLDTTPASINSALQRARATLDRRLPPRSQSEILDELGEDAARLVDDFVDALQAGDVARLTALLAEDVTFSMPPYPTWWQGRDVVLAFTAADTTVRRCVPLRVNGQLAFAGYRLEGERYLPELVEVLTVDAAGRITDITTFVDPSGPCEGEPAEPESDIASLFSRLGLPAALEDR
jgi:RNA polymerase sigma-70 factor (ECF subfamily)